MSPRSDVLKWIIESFIIIDKNNKVTHKIIIGRSPARMKLSAVLELVYSVGYRLKLKKEPPGLGENKILSLELIKRMVKKRFKKKVNKYELFGNTKSFNLHKIVEEIRCI
jgi:hypothetical protein